MMINDAIRNAEFEYEIYFLLAAYIEAVQFVAKLPEQSSNPPITGLNDLRTRFRQLIIELDNASTQLGEKVRPVIKEALHIYRAALNRLRSLDEEKNRSLGKHVPELSTSHIRRAIPDSIGILSIS